MKRKLVVVTLACLASSAAQAQSSVTIYGIVDGGLTYNSNSGGQRLYSFTSGNGAGDRWGFRGTEDLGGGLAAVFTLEEGFNIGTGAIGQGGTFWGRQAFVGLSSNKYGAITMGRQNVAPRDYVGAFASGSTWAAAGTGYGTHLGDIDNLNGTNRSNNSVKYTSPTYRGLTLMGMFGFGGIAGSTLQNRIVSAGASYANGPLNLGFSYVAARDPNYSFFGNTVNASGTATNEKAFPEFAGYATAKTQQIIATGGSYTLGSLIISAVYSNVAFSGLGAVTVTGLTNAQNAVRGSASFNTGELNLRYFVTPTFMLGTAYQYTKLGGVSNQDAHYHQVNAGALYYLSKSTDLYLIGVYQHASGNDSSGGAAVASIDGVTASTGRSQIVVTAGIEKKF